MAWFNVELSDKYKHSEKNIIFYYKHLYNTKNLSIILTHVNRHIYPSKQGTISEPVDTCQTGS